MSWTTDKPTRPGYYWLTNYRGDGESLTRQTTVIHAFRSHGDESLTITFTGKEIESSVDELVEAEWYGPLAIPPEGIDNSHADPQQSEAVTLKGGPFDGKAMSVPGDLWFLHIRMVDDGGIDGPIHQYRREFSDMKIFSYDRAACLASFA